MATWEITLASNAPDLKHAPKPALDFAWSKRKVAKGKCQRSRL